MYIGIMDLIRKCDHLRVAFVVGTVAAGALLMAPEAIAANEADIQRLIETNECAGLRPA